MDPSPSSPSGRPPGVPVVDASPIGLDKGREPAEEEMARFGTGFARALEECGFVVVVGHGVRESIVSSALSASRSFFHLSEEEKLSSYGRMGPDGHGFIPRGRETIDAAREERGRQGAPYEHREAYVMRDLTRTLPGDSPGHPEVLRDGRVRKSHQRVATDCGKLAARMLRSLALALGLERDFFYRSHPTAHPGNGHTGIRMNFYPGLEQGGGDEIPVGSVRCGEHRDFGTLTWVFESGGLQVKHPVYGWMDVRDGKSEDFGIVVNSALQLERWTSGRIPAALHRVLMPSDPKEAAKDRQSLVFYLYASEDTLVSPVVEGPKTFEPVKSGDHVRELLASIKHFASS